MRAITELFGEQIAWEKEFSKINIYLGNHIKKEFHSITEDETYPSTDNEILKKAKSYIDLMGECANVFEPYAKIAMQQCVDANTLSNDVCMEINDLYNKYGDLDSLVPNEIAEFDKALDELFDTTSQVSEVAGAKNYHEYCMKVYNGTVSGKFQVYDKIGLHSLRITARNYETSARNINNVMNKLNNQNITLYSQKFENILKQIENNCKVKMLSLN